jgi:hypothetical protein
MKMKQKVKRFWTKDKDVEVKRIQDQITDRHASLYNMMF